MFEEEKSKEQLVLEKFLSMSVKSSDQVFDAFKNIDGAKMYGTEPLKRFLYIKGTRDDKVLLVAHADTVWDKNWQPENNDIPQTLSYKYGVYSNSNKDANCGLGSDDRAGCAMLYLLQKSGHSILILDGEEHGQIGANFLKNEYPELFKEINSHQYALQFDRMGVNEYKCYDIPVSNQFKKYISQSMGLFDAGKKSKTDIVTLCSEMCGANISIGYYNEHTTNEILVYKEWLKAYNKVSKMLSNQQEKFDLQIDYDEYIL